MDLWPMKGCYYISSWRGWVIKTGKEEPDKKKKKLSRALQLEKHDKWAAQF